MLPDLGRALLSINFSAFTSAEHAKASWCQGDNATPHLCVIASPYGVKLLLLLIIALERQETLPLFNVSVITCKTVAIALSTMGKLFITARENSVFC
jgi:hypothetical protein